jgi:hypothetical protein
MNENAKLWVSELRSGKYKQGRGFLHILADDSYCCLGVACELAKSAGVIDSEQRDGVEAYGEFRHTGYLPAKVCNWLGIESDVGQFGSSTLTKLNDNGMPFDQIADTIEAQAEVLFTA